MSQKKKKLYGMRKYWPQLTEEKAIEQRQKLFDAQNGKCALCNKPESAFKHKLNVDHNHKTGQVRGLLCYRCNKYIIGRLDYATALKIVTYLSIEESFVIPEGINTKSKNKRKKEVTSKDLDEFSKNFTQTFDTGKTTIIDVNESESNGC